MKKNIIIVIQCIIVVVLIAVLQAKPTPILMHGNIYRNPGKNCVPNEKVALEIAKVIYEVRVGVEYEDEQFEVNYFKEGNDEWNVDLIEYDEKGRKVMKLCHSGVYIDKNNATILQEESWEDKISEERMEKLYEDIEKRYEEYLKNR